jgi:hypothetical protein
MKKIGIKLLTSSISIIALGGCQPTSVLHKQLTSFNVGCETEDILISDETFELNGTENWTAKCDGKTYSCTYLNESSTACYEITE